MARAWTNLFCGIILSLLSVSAQAIIPSIGEPAWSELTADQKAILQPLATEWDSLDNTRKKKWLGIAKRYPALTAAEQERIQRRMTDWIKLTPEERKLARDKFKEFQNSSPEKKAEVQQKWQEYKELPESEKERLKARAANRPVPPKPTAAAPPAAPATEIVPVAAPAPPPSATTAVPTSTPPPTQPPTVTPAQ